SAEGLQNSNLSSETSSSLSGANLSSPSTAETSIGTQHRNLKPLQIGSTIYVSQTNHYCFRVLILLALQGQDDLQHVTVNFYLLGKRLKMLVFQGRLQCFMHLFIRIFPTLRVK
ncbi:hypothetical protein J1N35_028524, partial [Gossypium stocksii]